MRINVKKRGPVARNLIFFVSLSFIYLFVLESISAGRSALSLASLQLYCLKNIYLVGFTLLVSYFIYSVKKISEWMLLAYFVLISFYSFSFFFENFDKFVLIFSFIYLLFAGNFFIFWKLELQDAVYSPGYNTHQIGLINKQKLNVRLKSSDLEYSGFLTNIGDNSCFVYIHGSLIPHGKKILLFTEFNGREFCSEGEVVTTYDHGVGLKLKENFRLKYKRTWNEYYGIIKDRGIYPTITGINQ